MISTYLHSDCNTPQTGAPDMMRMIATILAAAVGLALADRAFAAPPDAPDADSLVRAELLADRAAIAPGTTFTLGLRLKIKPHWHVYWLNPGAAGIPTEVDWRLPGGFSAADLRWPIPRRFDEPGGLTGYGYADEVLLATRITAPANLAPGQTVTLGVDSAWLVCEKLCVPGEAQLEITLPVAETARPANEKLFDRFAARWPANLDDVDQPRLTRVRTALPDPGEPAWMGLAVRWNDPPRDVDFFPAPPASLDVTRVTARTFGDTTRVQFQARRLGAAAPDTLAGLLVYTDPSDRRRAVWIDLPLKPDLETANTQR